MTYLIPIQPIQTQTAGQEAVPLPRPILLRAELADRMRAAYIEVGCPCCDHLNAVNVSHLKDVTRALVTCDGCGSSYRRDEAVSLTLLNAIGRNPR